jgi:hypothetical protein
MWTQSASPSSGVGGGSVIDGIAAAAAARAKRAAAAAAAEQSGGGMIANWMGLVSLLVVLTPVSVVCLIMTRVGGVVAFLLMLYGCSHQTASTPDPKPVVVAPVAKPAPKAPGIIYL